MGLGSIAVSLGRWAIGMGVGYLATTWVLRPYLRHDAGLTGRRSVIAGAAAAVSVLTAGAFLGPVAAGLQVLTGVCIGGVSTAAMFWPWLLSRETRLAMRELDPPRPVDV